MSPVFLNTQCPALAEKTLAVVGLLPRFVLDIADAAHAHEKGLDMGREIVLFKSEEKKSRGEVAAFLRELTDKFEAGRRATPDKEA